MGANSSEHEKPFQTVFRTSRVFHLLSKLSILLPTSSTPTYTPLVSAGSLAGSTRHGCSYPCRSPA